MSTPVVRSVKRRRVAFVGWGRACAISVLGCFQEEGGRGFLCESGRGCGSGGGKGLWDGSVGELGKKKRRARSSTGHG